MASIDPSCRRRVVSDPAVRGVFRLGVLFGLLAAPAAMLPADLFAGGMADPVVEPASLPGLIAREGPTLILLDCRSRKEYDVFRVAGATWVDVSVWKTASLAKEGLAARETWAGRFSSLGIGPDSRIVVLDDGSMTEAARVWFLLQHHGIRQVSILNGGFDALGPFLRGGQVASASGPAASFPDSRPSLPVDDRRDSCPVALAGKDAVLAAIDRRDAVILDVRTVEEYTGVDAEKNPRHGSLPNAVNIPHTQMMQLRRVLPTTQAAVGSKPRGRLKSPGELRSLFEQAGITPDRRVVVHCQSGGRAALAALALIRAGYGDVSNYYASFGEWSADPHLPVVSTLPATAPAAVPGLREL